MNERLPIAIIGAGPIGLAAASHLILRGEPVRVFEAAAQIAPNLRDWGHVRLFSIWAQCVDEAAVTLLKKNGWVSPPANKLPAGPDLVEDFLEPLPATPELAPIIETDASGIRVSGPGRGRVETCDRQ